MSSFHDSNGVATTIATKPDGKTLINLLCDPTSHALLVSFGDTGENNGNGNSFHDENHVPTIIAASKTDGDTTITVYASNSGNLLVEDV